MSQYEKAVEIWRSYCAEQPWDLDKYLDSFKVLFAYNSGKIENEAITYNDTREIFENGKVSAFTGDARALFEQQNQKLCYELLKPKIIAKEQLSLELIKEIHAGLTGGTYDEQRYISRGERPGEFKKHDYVTGVHQVGSPAQEVEQDLLELINEINEHGDTKDTLKVATYLHLRFEYIHPFADGNGRAGRTLLNYYLMINGHPPLVVFDEDKRQYYECLQKYDEAEEIAPLYEFFKQQTEKTWAKQIALKQGESQSRKGLNDLS